MFTAKDFTMHLSKFLTVALVAILFPLTANAQKMSCSKPIDVYDTKQPVPGYCNVYDRQLAYREERLKFRQMIEDRRTEFIKPQLEAEKDYAQKLEALHARRSHENDITAK